MMKVTRYLMLALFAAMCLTSCNDSETYGDKKKKEREAISKFIANEKIHVIDEATFKANGNKTDTLKNEYVYLNNFGVYMQIVNEGCGTNLLKMPDSKQINVNCRCVEYDIMSDAITLRSDVMTYYNDIMAVYHTGSQITASFIKSSGAMYQTYSAAVPNGWMAPFEYIKIGRPSAPGEDIAYVRLIVPHTQGHTVAASSVLPYHYEITYELSK